MLSRSRCWHSEQEAHLNVADFIFISSCQNDKVGGFDIKVLCLTVILTSMQCDVGVLMIALVV